MKLAILIFIATAVALSATLLIGGCAGRDLRASWWLKAVDGCPARWPEAALPAAVFVEVGTHPRLRRRVEAAILKVNEAAGRELLRPGTLPGGGGWVPGAVSVSTSRSMSGGLCTARQDPRTGHLSAMLVEVGHDAHPDVVLHELMHAVGLGHAGGADCWRAVMCPQVSDGVKVSDGSRRWLRRVYGGGRPNSCSLFKR